MKQPNEHECISCGESIEGYRLDALRDMPYVGADGTVVPTKCHVECGFRDVMGGAGHWMDHAHWCGKMRDPDGGMSRRDSALWVWEHREELLQQQRAGNNED